jgi:hypothetical protein
VVSERRARELAEAFAASQGRALATAVTELERGWYFAWESDGRVGSHGLAVNKDDGRIFAFGSAFSVERDLSMYDRGMDAEKHDLVVVAVENLEETLAFLQALAPSTVDLSFEHGTVWRIPRILSRSELESSVSKLPAIFPDLSHYFSFEAVEAARSSGCCVFEVLPRGR